MRNRKIIWSLLGTCTATAFLAFAYPMYVIRPFRAQGPGELTLALLVRSWAPLLGSLAAGIALVCTFLLWQSAGRARMRALSVVACVFTLLFAGLTNVNVYEMMFHRIDSPEVMAASAATLERDDMVLSVRVEELARAYPIRMMGYHHIVNDRVGSVPIVATY